MGIAECFLTLFNGAVIGKLLALIESVRDGLKMGTKLEGQEKKISVADVNRLDLFTCNISFF